MFSVPQFIDVEDKIAGPLTWRQLLWMIGMGASLLTLFSMFETAAAIVLGIPVALLFIAFAFYRPNGFPMTTFVFHSIMFLFRPKMAVWERPLKKTKRMADEKPDSEKPVMVASENQGSKELTQNKIRELARLLDSKEGM